MAAELNSAEYAYLIILLAEDREISNNELFERYEVRLVGAERKGLIAEKYVLSPDKPTPYTFTLTAEGRKALRRPLPVTLSPLPKGTKRGTGERQLFWAALLASQKLIARGTPLTLADPTPVTGSAPATGSTPIADSAPIAGSAPVGLGERVRAAYAELAGSPGEWIKLEALRGRLSDVSKAELDKTLERMLDDPDVRLEPEPLGKRTGTSAVHIGGEDRHKLAIGVR
jgi:hypothetical protein